MDAGGIMGKRRLKMRSNPFGAPWVKTVIRKGVLKAENGYYGVTVWHEGDRDGIGAFTYLTVSRKDGKPIDGFDDLQRIKNDLVSPKSFAIEIYPPQKNLIDALNVRHLRCYNQDDARKVLTPKSVKAAAGIL